MPASPGFDAPAPRDELDRVARNLYDALGEARPYIYGRTLPEGHPERDWRSETADVVLDRIDAALADAGELLSGGAA